MLSADEAHGDCSEFLLHKQVDMDAQKSLATFSSSRRLLIAVMAGKIVYGATMHARHRQRWFTGRFQLVSANYVSAILQTTVAQQAPAPTQPEPQLSLSQTQRGFAAGLTDAPRGGDTATGAAQVYQVSNIQSFARFLEGRNAQNNPQCGNMAQTLGCTFPCY